MMDNRNEDRLNTQPPSPANTITNTIGIQLDSSFDLTIYHWLVFQMKGGKKTKSNQPFPIERISTSFHFENKLTGIKKKEKT